MSAEAVAVFRQPELRAALALLMDRFGAMAVVNAALAVKEARDSAIPGRRFDWAAMIFELERLGLSQRDIAHRCDVSGHSWVNNLKNIPGTQPKFHDGAVLLSVWAEVTGKSTAEAPPG